MMNEKEIAMSATDDVNDMEALARLCDTPKQRQRRAERRMKEACMTEVHGIMKWLTAMAVGAAAFAAIAMMVM